jgi:hypothetical protein
MMTTRMIIRLIALMLVIMIGTIVTTYMIGAIMTCLFIVEYNIERCIEIVKKMTKWFHRTKLRRRSRIKKHAMSYYTYGNSKRMTRACRNRSTSHTEHYQANDKHALGFPYVSCLIGSAKKLSERRYIGIDTMSTYCLTPC